MIPVLVLGLAAASPTYGPETPKPIKKPAAVRAASDPCLDRTAEPGVILVCGKQEDFRIDPVVLEARKRLHNNLRPRPREKFADTTCKTVGPMGCIGQSSFEVFSALGAAVTMAQKLASGQNVGKMFVTEHDPSEYELYQEIKREKELADTGSAPPPQR
ncbi:hypothetical protein GCM10022281_14850 [Sphingomonas rosea]|uniref:DUF4189 domain-containing protein n=1 Tax=Sphingomonas rosea TaxID=335605 RepID=A0ABP7U3R2_9SPHN